MTGPAVRETPRRTPRRSSRAPGSPRGQATVEFALVLPLLTVLLFLIVDMGFAFFQIFAVSSATRSATRDGGVRYLSDEMIRARIAEACQGLGVTDQEITIRVTDGLGASSGSSVRAPGSYVEVAVDHPGPDQCPGESDRVPPDQLQRVGDHHGLGGLHPHGGGGPQGPRWQVRYRRRGEGHHLQRRARQHLAGDPLGERDLGVEDLLPIPAGYPGSTLYATYEAGAQNTSVWYMYFEGFLPGQPGRVRLVE